MPRRTHYSPCIDRGIICALYHGGRRLRRPMMRLVNDLLTSCLRDTEGWSIAAKQMSVPAQGRTQQAPSKHPASTQQAPSKHPASTQQAPSKHPASTQQAPSKHPASTQQAASNG